MKRFLCLIMILALMMSAIPALAFEELAKGSKGDAVIKLQERLNELGYSVGTADGDFGGKTEKAIIQYQKDNGLEETGVLDEITYGALFQDEADTRLMDVVNNSLLNVAAPSYPSALRMDNVEDTAKASNKPNTQPVVSETKKEYSENECKEIALAYMKEHIHSYLKNPASLQIISVTGGKAEGNEYLFAINFTAMNSFGGYTPGSYYCTVDYTTGEVTMGGMV